MDAHRALSMVEKFFFFTFQNLDFPTTQTVLSASERISTSRRRNLKKNTRKTKERIYTS